MKKFALFCYPSLTTSKVLSRLLVIVALAFAFSIQLHAQAGTPKISIQGTLKTANGASVVDGSYAVTFKLYTIPIGGAAVWSEDTIVEVIGGIYSHYLGSVTPLNPANFATVLYLGVKIGAYELVPRSELAYSPYAVSVGSAQTVICSGAVGDVKYSILNPAQFDAVNGDCWVPMDGRALVAGDKLRQITGMANVPDGSGLFLRSQEFSGGADNDPDRSSGTGIATIQQDNLKAHNHTMQSAGDHNHDLPIDTGSGGILANNPMLHLTDSNCGSCIISSVGANYFAKSENAGGHTHSIDNTGGSETRPKNLNFWIYIRIN